MRLLAVLCSPRPSVKTKAVAEAVLAGAQEVGADVELLEMTGGEPPPGVQASMGNADGIVFASPTYRADVSWPLRALLDQTPRGFWGETDAPLEGKACATVLTGASDHHFLGMDKIRAVLSGFFAMQVLSPGLYVQRTAFAEDGELLDDVRAVANLHGRALADLAAAVRGSENLRTLRPLV